MSSPTGPTFDESTFPETAHQAEKLKYLTFTSGANLAEPRRFAGGHFG
jgi:hypothetical protein